MRFLDGPAKGSCLSLQRAPLFLRVVVDQDGTVDALDQLDDTPRPTEVIHVYHLASEPARVHVCRAGGRGGMGITADYRLYEVQPTDDQARDPEKWPAWCQGQAELLRAPT